MSGRIYFIGCQPLEAVKIGFTSGQPRVRLKALQTGCPAPLKGLAHFPGTQEEERRLHAAFEPLRIQGEWFRFEGKLVDFILYMRDASQSREITRDAFEMALHDVLMQGYWTWDDMPPPPGYYETADWQPFRHILWANHGPWVDA